MVHGPASFNLTVVTARLALLLVVALALRLGWGLTRPTDESALAALPDQIEYLALGKSLLAGDGLVFTDARFGTPVHAFRAPGYPTFVAMLGASVTGVRVAQAVLDTLTVLGAALLARRVFGRGELVAALLVALNPFSIYFASLILTETLFTSLLVWGTLLLLTGGTRVFVVGIGVLAVSVLVRPGAVALPVVLATVAAMSRTTLPRVPAALTAAVLTAAVLAPWAYRNHKLLNDWVWTTTNAGFTAYDGFGPHADGRSDQARFIPAMPELGDLTETQRNDYLLKLAAQSGRRTDPSLAAAKLLRTWSPFPLSEGHRSTGTIVVGVAYCGVAWSLALLGLFRGPKLMGAGGRVTLFVPAVYLTLSAIASVGSLRYRLPAEPLLAVLAAGGAIFLTAPKLPRRPDPQTPDPVSYERELKPL